MWEVSWRLNRIATYWPQTLLAITAFLSHSPGLLNRGPGGPASAATWFSFQHLLSPTYLNLLSLGLYNNLTPTYFLRASHFTLNSTHRQSRYIPDILTRRTCYLHRCISHFDSLAGVNMQHFPEHQMQFSIILRTSGLPFIFLVRRGS